MKLMIEKLFLLGPFFFGVLIFGPMWAAVLDLGDAQLLNSASNLAICMLVGGAWGLLAIKRRRWL
jgi:hypothetical protein